MAEPSLRVLQLLGPSTGGIRRHVAALADRLEERDWQVGVAGPAGVMDGLRPLDHVVAIGRDLRGVAGAARTLRRARRGRDLVHAHGLTAGWVACLVPGGPPVVVSVHNLVLDEAEGRRAGVLRRLEGRLLARADAVIAISDQVARRFTGLRGADRITVIPPVAPVPVVSREPAAVRTALGVGAGAALVVLVGRLHPQKDIGTLLEATARLRTAGRALAVVVAGDGPQRAELEAAARRLDVADVVTFLGARTDAPDLMAAADVVVMCSIWESYGIVVAEALQLGRPVVATDVGPVADLVLDGRTGRLVPPSSPGALAAAIADLLDDPAEAARLGTAGAEHAARAIGADGLTDRVVALYEKVVAVPRPRTGPRRWRP